MSRLKKTKKNHVLSIDETLGGEAFFEAKKKALKALEAEAPNLVVDASKLEKLDAWAVSFLVGASKSFAEAGGAFAVKNLPERLKPTLAQAGLEGLLLEEGEK